LSVRGKTHTAARRLCDVRWVPGADHRRHHRRPTAPTTADCREPKRCSRQQTSTQTNTQAQTVKQSIERASEERVHGQGSSRSRRQCAGSSRQLSRRCRCADTPAAAACDVPRRG
jgi:hypothetical protein